MNSIIKIMVLFSLLLMSSCSIHSFQSKKHQLSNFYGSKTEQVSTSPIQNKKNEDNPLKFDTLTTKNPEILGNNSYTDNVAIGNDSMVITENHFSEIYKATFFNSQFDNVKKEKKPNEEKAKRFSKVSNRFLWLFFTFLTLTLILSLVLMDYFLIPLVGGLFFSLIPTILHSIYSSLVIKYSGDTEVKRKARAKFWLILGIYSLLLIALALVIVLVFL